MRQFLFILSICSAMLVGLPSTLARGIFAMDPAKAEMYLPMVQSYLKGELKAETAERPGNNDQGYIRPFAINPETGEKYRLVRQWDENGYVFDFIGVTKGSIAVIPMNDVIMKYDYCGMFGTISLVDVLNIAQRNGNIVGVILDMDTPGGEVYGTKNLSDAVGNCTIPVVTHINDGYCASAGMYIACKSSKILMAQSTDKVGSIGVYTTLIDVKGAFEKEGYKIMEIYSPASPEKNRAWRDAMEKGKAERMEKELLHMDNVFMQQVREGRGAKLNEKALEGGMFYTDEAIEMGLCDGYATFEQAIEEVLQMSRGSLIIS